MIIMLISCFFAWSQNVRNSFWCRLLLRTENNKVKTFRKSMNNSYNEQGLNMRAKMLKVLNQLPILWLRSKCVTALFWCHLATTLFNRSIWLEQINKGVTLLLNPVPNRDGFWLLCSRRRRKRLSPMVQLLNMWKLSFFNNI